MQQRGNRTDLKLKFKQNPCPISIVRPQIFHIMITLTKRLRGEATTNSSKDSQSPDKNSNSTRISIRDKLLVKEVQEMECNLPTGCKVKFDDPNALHEFCLTITPDEGFWQGGKFKFHILVGEDYNISPPTVKCLTKLWHPNINEDGQVCLSILRQNSLDGMGWAPTRRLRDVIWGLNSLFSDLLNFDDPLNTEAAEHYQRDKDGFRLKAKQWVAKYAKR